LIDCKSYLKEICRKLGITDFDNIIPAVEKIQLVVRLIPQMEQVKPLVERNNTRKSIVYS
jgi:hypothetical protein